MITLCLASSAWLAHRGASLGLLNRFYAGHSNSGDSIQIDLPTILREGVQCTEPQPSSYLHEIHFNDWVKDGLTDNGVLNVERIRNAPIGFPLNGLVVLNAAGYNSQIVLEALSQARMSLYPLNEWPTLFVVIIDDPQLFQISPFLASTFYVQPQIRTHTIVQREIAILMVNAKVRRFLGRRPFLPIAFLMKFVVARFNKKHSKDLKIKNIGWTTEE